MARLAVGLLMSKSSASSSGGGSHVLYTQITSATRTITDSELKIGTNIFGVNYDGGVTITLPSGISPRKIIVINDESGAAGTNNITIQVI